MSTEERDAQRLAQLFAVLENEEPPALAPAWPEGEAQPDGAVNALFGALENEAPPRKAPAWPEEDEERASGGELLRPIWWQQREWQVVLALAAAILLSTVAWSLAWQPAPPAPVVELPEAPVVPVAEPPAPLPPEPEEALVQVPEPAPEPGPIPEEPQEQDAVVDAWEPVEDPDEPGLVPKGIDPGVDQQIPPTGSGPELELVLAPEGLLPGEHPRLVPGTVLRFRVQSSAPAAVSLCVTGPEMSGTLWTGRVPAGQRDLHGVLYLLEQPGSYHFGLALEPDCRDLLAAQPVEVRP